MIPYEFDPPSPQNTQESMHLKVYDPTLITGLLEYVRQTGIQCVPLEAVEGLTEYEVHCSQAEFTQLDTYLKQHRSK